MEAIIGLIIKDFLQTKRQQKTLIIYIVLALPIIMIGKNISFGIFFVILGFAMYGSSSFSYDELAMSDRFMSTLPITKHDILLSKYLFAILSTMVGLIIGFCLTFVSRWFIGTESTAPYMKLNFYLSVFFALALLESIQIPIYIKYGVEKARAVLLAFTAFTYLLFFAILNALPLFENLHIEGIFSILTKEPVLSLFLLLGIPLTYCISFGISKHIYLCKEL